MAEGDQVSLPWYSPPLRPSHRTHNDYTKRYRQSPEYFPAACFALRPPGDSEALERLPPMPMIEVGMAKHAERRPRVRDESHALSAVIAQAGWAAVYPAPYADCEGDHTRGASGRDHRLRSACGHQTRA